MIQVPLEDYGYANARVRAMMARLLDEYVFRQLLEAPDYHSALGVLEDTEYAREVEEAALEGINPTNIDRALTRNLARNFDRIKHFISGRPQELINVLLSRWDLYNLKTVLRGKRALVPNPEIERNLVPIGFLDMITLGEIIHQPDLRSVLDAVVVFSLEWPIPYGRAITATLAEFLYEYDLSIVETALDQLHYRYVTSMVRGRDLNSTLVRQVITMEIDIIDVVNLLRLCGLELDSERALRFFIPEGSLSRDEFINILSQGQPEAVAEEVVRLMPQYREPIFAGMKQFDEKGETAVQDEMEKHMIRTCIHLTRDPLGIGVIIKYMWKKYLEVLNLRIIIRGKSIGLIESQIRKELFLVDEVLRESA